MKASYKNNNFKMKKLKASYKNNNFKNLISNLDKNNFTKTVFSIFLAFSMIFCSVFFNLKTIEKSFADGDMEYAVDSAEVLTTEELESLKSKLAQISDENNIDVGVVTVDYLDGKTAQEFANDLFEQNKFGKGENRDGILLLVATEDREWAMSTHGSAKEAFNEQEFANDLFEQNKFGKGENRDGILLLVATEDREWAMSTHGSAKEAFNEEGLDFLSGEFLPYLAEDDYYSAFENFANNAGELSAMYVLGDPYGEEEYVDDESYPIDENIVEEEKGINNEVWIPFNAGELSAMYVLGDPYGEEEYVDDESYPIDENIVEEEKGINNEVWIPLSIVIGCAISLVIMMMYKSQLKSVKSESRADDYLMDMKLVKSQDIFLYRTVTRTMRPKNENNSKEQMII